LFNYNQLQNLPGELSVFLSQSGISQLFEQMFSTNKIGLKLGWPVMLINKFNERTINALGEAVTKLDTDDVEVKFIVEQKVVSVTTSKVSFTIYDPVDKIILAKGVQHLMLLNFLVTTRTKTFH
jgi:hypothetical protein